MEARFHSAAGFEIGPARRTVHGLGEGCPAPVSGQMTTDRHALRRRAAPSTFCSHKLPVPLVLPAPPARPSAPASHARRRSICSAVLVRRVRGVEPNRNRQQDQQIRASSPPPGPRAVVVAQLQPAMDTVSFSFMMVPPREQEPPGRKKALWYLRSQSSLVSSSGRLRSHAPAGRGVLLHQKPWPTAAGVSPHGLGPLGSPAGSPWRWPRSSP